MEVFLVRHGETEWSLSGQHTSRTDLPLIDAGRERARALGGELAEHQFALVLSSPFRRALETAELAGFGDRIEVDEELREWDYGQYEGITTPQIREQNPDWDLWRDGCPDGESPEQIGARADHLLERITRVEGNVLLFAHGHILRVLAARWIALPVNGGARLALKAGAICVLGFERETQVIQKWNA